MTIRNPAQGVQNDPFPTEPVRPLERTENCFKMTVHPTAPTPTYEYGTTTLLVQCWSGPRLHEKEPPPASHAPSSISTPSTTLHFDPTQVVPAWRRPSSPSRSFRCPSPMASLCGIGFACETWQSVSSHWNRGTEARTGAEKGTRSTHCPGHCPGTVRGDRSSGRTGVERREGPWERVLPWPSSAPSLPPVTRKSRAPSYGRSSNLSAAMPSIFDRLKKRGTTRSVAQYSKRLS